MNTLYTDLAAVYEAMYQTFINYVEELQLYRGLLDRVQCRTVVEIGCGSGNLAPGFVQAGYRYTGLDLSADMLALARQKHPESNFIQADMRQFDLPEQTEGVIMTGRTISYLRDNRDVFDCFTSVRQCLKPGGLFCFDFIDASRFIPRVVEGEKITHHASHAGRRYFRDSYWKTNLDHGWAIDWQSEYFEETADAIVRIGEDHSTIRTFAKDEIELFLKITGFEVVDCIDRASYAFETCVIVAK